MGGWTDTAVVAQAALLVEDKDVRSSRRPVLQRDLLRGAVRQELKVEVPVSGPLLDLRKRIAGIGVAHFLSRRFDEAATKFVISLEELPTWAVTCRFLASCYAHMGRLSEAREIVVRLRTTTSVVVPEVVPFRNPEHRELFLSGLRLAAGETT